MNKGVLALIGGDEFQSGCEFDQNLLALSGGKEVVVLPTAAALEHPEKRVIDAAGWFSRFGGEVEGLMVTARAEANDPGIIERLSSARFVYLTGGSALHLRSVLKDSALFEVLCNIYENGGVVAAAGSAAMVLSDPMVDPRGGAPMVGLGLVKKMAIVSHYGDPSEDPHGEKLKRSEKLFGDGVVLVGLPAKAALIRKDETWTLAGTPGAVGFRGGVAVDDLLGTLNENP